ncbi:M20 aminoacylase family protein [Rhodoligotrophos defluvii]|uniref:M20 aminoacylase family protein n=1 Tax=Rhodoligotrophos defluvii TaxID=2561934 RepID=UPI0010C97D21|nr:M20 aminoacylase family protein [Rhodoligotrophos defluvii]
MILAEIQGFERDLVAMRRHLHQQPELAFEEYETSAFVAARLEEWGYEVTRGIGGTGVIGTLRNGNSPRSLGLRADMDALPIQEETGIDYASRVPGKMHACGHDGHTAMLLGAARYLAQARPFTGTLHLIFQPAEEHISGAKRMVEEGLFERFPCDAVFALHNMPNVPLGHFMFKPGPIMAASDLATITMRGAGGHSAMPHLAADPIVAAATLVVALQSIVSRNRDPQEPAVLTVGTFHAGTVSNVIPDDATLTVDIRTFSPQMRAFIEQRLVALSRAQAESFGVVADIQYEKFYPVTSNAAAETEFVRDVALRHAGPDRVIDLTQPFPYSEDFAYMLEVRPGSYFMLGIGNGPRLHTSTYDFNDEALAIGASFWARLVREYLKSGM